MVILFGHQGSGKSRFVKWFTQPVREMYGEATLGSYCDTATQSLKEDNLIIHLAEMAGASKQDSEVLKSSMEAGLSQSRAHYSHGSLVTYNRAQLIGTTNKDISEVIKDDTGNRRFIQFTLGKPGYNISYESFNIRGLWASVSVDDLEPLSNHTLRAKVQNIQKNQKKIGIYEQWFNDNSEKFFGEEKAKTQSEIYDDFKDYVEHYGASHDRSNINNYGFKIKIADLARNNNMKLIEKKTKGNRKYYFDMNY